MHGYHWLDTRWSQRPNRPHVRVLPSIRMCFSKHELSVLTCDGVRDWVSSTARRELYWSSCSLTGAMSTELLALPQIVYVHTFPRPRVCSPCWSAHCSTHFGVVPFFVCAT